MIRNRALTVGNEAANKAETRARQFRNDWADTVSSGKPLSLDTPKRDADPKRTKRFGDPEVRFFFDPNTFVTEIILNTDGSLDSSLTFEQIVDAASPIRWKDASAGSFERLDLLRMPDGVLTFFTDPVLNGDGSGSWEAGHFLREKVEWSWTPDLSTAITNVLGINHQVDTVKKTITTDFWLYQCLETDIFDTRIPGGLDVDAGFIKTTVRQNNVIQIEAKKRLRFTDRIGASGADALAVGTLLNYSAGGIVAGWMKNVLLAFEKAIPESPKHPGDPVERSVPRNVRRVDAPRTTEV